MSDQDGSADAPIEVHLTLGDPYSHELDVRVSPRVAEEMESDLNAEGVFGGHALEFSAGAELAILVASTLGGGGGLAAALTAFLHRNRHKNMSFSYKDVSVQVSGPSEEATKRLVSEAVQQMRKLQVERDIEWRQVLGQRSPDED